MTMSETLRMYTGEQTTVIAAANQIYYLLFLIVLSRAEGTVLAFVSIWRLEDGLEDAGGGRKLAIRDDERVGAIPRPRPRPRTVAARAPATSSFGGTEGGKGSTACRLPAAGALPPLSCPDGSSLTSLLALVLPCFVRYAVFDTLCDGISPFPDVCEASTFSDVLTEFCTPDAPTSKIDAL